MLSLLEVNARRPRCRQCGSLSDMVEVAGHADRRELAGLHAANEFLQFVPRIRQLTQCGIGEAKATYLHLAKSGGQCHYCGTPLASADIVDCAKCKSLNLVW